MVKEVNSFSQKARTQDQAGSIPRKAGGTGFDPALVEAFIQEILENGM